MFKVNDIWPVLIQPINLWNMAKQEKLLEQYDKLSIQYLRNRSNVMYLNDQIENRLDLISVFDEKAQRIEEKQNQLSWLHYLRTGRFID